VVLDDRLDVGRPFGGVAVVGIKVVAPFVDHGASIAVGARTSGGEYDDNDGVVVVREAALAALSALVVTMMC
jgi:hypothetical protein